MSIKRLVLCIALLSVGFLLATSAQAKKFALTGGGGQVHIGNGLMLPIQAAATSATAGTVFPTLLVPPKAGAVVSGTVAKTTLLTGMATAAGPVTKVGYQKKLTIPAGVLHKSAAQTTVGVKFSNAALFAVATNLTYDWPAAPAVMSTGAAIITTVVAGNGGTVTYSNSLGSRFGGPASFLAAPGPAAGLIPGAPLTLYLKINATTPACTHPAFGGTDGGCLAGLMQVKPTGLFGVGGPTTAPIATPGGAIAPNLAAVKLGTSPLGTILAKVAVATTPLPTNMALSQPAPWTTGKIVVSMPAVAEKFTISGKDSRTVGGFGSIQLVGGSVSARAASGPNANRGWIRLDLADSPFPNGVPAMSPSLLAAVGGLILLAGGFAARRQFSA